MTLRLKTRVKAIKGKTKHTAALMQQQGINEAILYINRIPCSGKTDCDAMLPLMLPEGAKLTVIGPNGFIKTYMGLPD
jgi:hypothetical protein